MESEVYTNLELGMTLPQTIENYIFERVIGHGKYATVFQVRSLKYDKDFAAKVSLIDSSSILPDGQLVDAELMALINLNHPHIIRFYDYFLISNYLVVIFEICNNGTLFDKLRNEGPLDADSIRVIAFDVLRALQDCHKCKIAHRDLKLANILIDEYKRYKLADFNLSCMLPNGQDLLHSDLCGSLPFIAPEVLARGEYNPYLADIWSFGVCLFQLHTGLFPWSNSDIMSNNFKPIDYGSSFDPFLKEVLESIFVEPSLRPSASDLLKFFSLKKPMARLPYIKCSLKKADSTSIQTHRLNDYVPMFNINRCFKRPRKIRSLSSVTSRF